MDADLKRIRLGVPDRVAEKLPPVTYSLKKLFDPKKQRVMKQVFRRQPVAAGYFSSFPTRTHKYKVNRSVDGRVHIHDERGVWSYVAKPVLHVPRQKTSDDIKGDLLVGARHAIRQLARDKFDIKRVDRAWNRFAKLRELPDNTHGWLLDHDGKLDDYTDFPLTITESKYEPSGVKRKVLKRLEFTRMIERLPPRTKLLLRPDQLKQQPRLDLVPQFLGIDISEEKKALHDFNLAYSTPYKVERKKIRSKELFPTFPLNKHWWIKGDLKVEYYRVVGHKRWTWRHYHWTGPPLSKYYLEMVDRARKVRSDRQRKVLDSVLKEKKAKKRKYIARCLRLCFRIMQLFTKRGHDLRHWLLLKLGESKYRMLRRACRIFRRRQIRYFTTRSNVIRHARLARKGRERKLRRKRRRESGNYAPKRSVFRKPRCRSRVVVSIGRRSVLFDESRFRKVRNANFRPNSKIPKNRSVPYVVRRRRGIRKKRGQGLTRKNRVWMNNRRIRRQLGIKVTRPGPVQR